MSKISLKICNRVYSLVSFWAFLELFLSLPLVADDLACMALVMVAAPLAWVDPARLVPSWPSSSLPPPPRRLCSTHHEKRLLRIYRKYIKADAEYTEKTERFRCDRRCVCQKASCKARYWRLQLNFTTRCTQGDFQFGCEMCMGLFFLLITGYAINSLKSFFEGSHYCKKSMPLRAYSNL